MGFYRGKDSFLSHSEEDLFKNKIAYFSNDLSANKYTFKSDQHELFQSIAPKTEAGLYLVPKVIE
jgi:hypothetical protein